MPIFKYLGGGHTKEPTFTYFENTNEPIRIKLGNISAVYSNKKWKIDNKPNDDYNENNGNKDNEDNENEKDKHQYNKKLQKRNKELENENQQLKWKIEVLLLKLAEAKYEIEQLREAE